MRWRDRIIVLVGVLGGLALLFTASGLMGGIHQAREEMGLVVNAPLESGLRHGGHGGLSWTGRGRALDAGRPSQGGGAVL